MVWARNKLVIYDDIFEPHEEIFINYSGPHPERLYPYLQEIIPPIFNIPKSNVQEISFTWETPSDDETKFNIWWRIIKQMDIHSHIRVDLKLKGFAKKGKGPATISIDAALITEYPQDTLLQQSIFYEMGRRFWHAVVYHKKRMEYIEMGRRIIRKFEEEIKKFLEELREHGV